jgi:hypothetical protein
MWDMGFAIPYLAPHLAKQPGQDRGVLIPIPKGSKAAQTVGTDSTVLNIGAERLGYLFQMEMCFK